MCIDAFTLCSNFCLVVSTANVSIVTDGCPYQYTPAREEIVRAGTSLVNFLDVVHYVPNKKPGATLQIPEEIKGVERAAHTFPSHLQAPRIHNLLFREESSQPVTDL